jgi:hypothetical protein
MLGGAFEDIYQEPVGEFVQAGLEGSILQVPGTSGWSSGEYHEENQAFLNSFILKPNKLTIRSVPRGFDTRFNQISILKYILYF